MTDAPRTRRQRFHRYPPGVLLHHPRSRTTKPGLTAGSGRGTGVDAIANLKILNSTMVCAGHDGILREALLITRWPS